VGFTSNLARICREGQKRDRAGAMGKKKKKGIRNRGAARGYVREKGEVGGNTTAALLSLLTW